MTPAQRPPSPPRDLLGALATTVTHAHTLEDLVRPLLQLLQRFTGLESTYLTTVDERAGVQHVMFALNTQQMHIPEGLSVPWDGTLCKRALEEARAYTDDVTHCWGDCEAARALRIVTYVSTPVRIGHGELFGTLCAASETRKPMMDGAEDILQLFAQLISQQVEREKLLVDLHHANSSLAVTALTDVITQLPNRRALMQDMQQRLAADSVEHAVIVGFIDMDDFKAINDEYGHDIGDRFLEAMGRRLLGVLRSDDFAARLGGDEFVVVATVKRETADAAAIALKKRWRSATRGWFALGPVEFHYNGPSIGIAIAEPGCCDAQALLNQADAAMYMSKRARKAKKEAKPWQSSPRSA